MTTLTATEASRGFSKLLDRVERFGEEFEITRDGKSVAKVTPAPRGGTAADLQAAFEEMRADGVPLFDDDFLENHRALMALLLPWEPPCEDA